MGTRGDELRVALVGCGQIADAHLQQARRTGLARIVAVCDREPDLAHQAAARFGVPAEYDDFDRLLRETTPDVVHITTPPAAHGELLLSSLEAGAHAYVEKPFALTFDETADLLGAAAARERVVCVGHDRLFDPSWTELCARVEGGEIGSVAHVEWTQHYDVNGPFGRLVLADPGHWVRGLPGGLFQNALPHALAAIVEYLPDRNPAIAAAAWGHERGQPSELQVFVRGSQVTAGLTFLTTAGPAGSYVRVYGTDGWIEADFEARAVRTRRAPEVPSLLVKLAVPLRQCRESASAFVRNARRFSRADLHYFAGLHALLRAFYRAVLDGRPSPITSDRVLRVAALMDGIIRALPRRRSMAAADAEPARIQ